MVNQHRAPRSSTMVPKYRGDVRTISVYSTVKSAHFAWDENATPHAKCALLTVD